jgi:hypothetical protein
LAGAILVVTTAASAAKPASDERHRERIRGDDDPIVVPALVPELENAKLRQDDPETIGSVGDAGSNSRPPCRFIKFFPDRPPRDQFQEACSNSRK